VLPSVLSSACEVARTRDSLDPRSRSARPRMTYFCHSCEAAQPLSENPSRGRKATAKVLNSRGGNVSVKTHRPCRYTAQRLLWDLWRIRRRHLDMIRQLITPGGDVVYLRCGDVRQLLKEIFQILIDAQVVFLCRVWVSELLDISSKSVIHSCRLRFLASIGMLLSVVDTDRSIVGSAVFCYVLAIGRLRDSPQGPAKPWIRGWGFAGSSAYGQGRHTFVILA
jgi:hypothetical protein